MQFSIFQHLRAISTSVRVLNVGQSVDVRTRVLKFRTGRISHRIFHRYVPRGPQTPTSGASTTTGSGPIKQPDETKPETGGQTNTSTGSGTSGGRAA
ncbi:uncharacterized protein ARMOST_02598 [Armillaria ostoyae]|uniref:Uncharacterized protein n=1 Tax=Armillaria ostoyae TaxID=47428 RepID=A0A284QS62_ARMOS|nr:uncharacterized protein ARMOST_02598 [Armillaria ostoyae]